MPNIKPPPMPHPSDDVRGPNAPSTVNPGFGDPFRNPAGDTVPAGGVAGRAPSPPRDMWGYPVRR